MNLKVETMYVQSLFMLKLFVSPGKLQTSSSTQKIEVSNGDDLPFQCEIPPRTNLKCPSLVLKRVDGNTSYPTSVIYTCRNGKEDLDSQYRNRVDFIDEDMRRGLMTVWIRSVQQSDSGKYKWFIPNSKYACSFDVVGKLVHELVHYLILLALLNKCWNCIWLGK